MIASVRSRYGFKKAVHVIDVPVRKSIEGYIYHGNRVYKNIIVSNFYKLLFGSLLDINADSVVDIDGAIHSISTRVDASAGSAMICTGSGTEAETFTDYRITTVECLSTAGTFSGNRISFSGVTTRSASEIGVIQALFDTWEVGRNTLLARRVANIAAGTGVIYDFVFGNPFTHNLVRLMYGILTNTDNEMYDADTLAIFTARSGGDYNASSVYLAITSDAVTYNFNLTNIPNPIYITSYNLFTLTQDINYIAIVGRHKPTADINVRAIGIYQNIFDTTGSYHRALLAVLSLPSPITLRAGITNMLIVRLVAI